MQGYLFKKSEKNKKWKSLYFVLIVDEADTHLCFYDNPKVSYRLFIFCFLYLVGMCRFQFSNYCTRFPVKRELNYICSVVAALKQIFVRSPFYFQKMNDSSKYTISAISRTYITNIKCNTLHVANCN